MCLKTMEKIDKGEDEKHACKLTSNPEDRNLYITCHNGHMQLHAALFNNKNL